MSPLLANIYLNEFDQEMARRGVKVVRYADDIVVVTKSKRAAEHMLESCRKFLEGETETDHESAKEQGGFAVFSSKLQVSGPAA